MLIIAQVGDSSRTANDFCADSEATGREGETTSSSRAHAKRSTGAEITGIPVFVLKDRASLMLGFLK